MYLQYRNYFLYYRKMHYDHSKKIIRKKRGNKALAFNDYSILFFLLIIKCMIQLKKVGDSMETLFISFLPVFLLGRYIYKHDKNKEPMKLLIRLFVSGVGSCFLVIFISLIMGSIFPIFNADTETLSLFELSIYVFVGVALVEEFCKWFMSYSIAFNNNEFEEVYDMIQVIDFDEDKAELYHDMNKDETMCIFK